MAEETPNPAPGGEEKSPVFQTGMGAFDRAGFNKTFAETKGLGVKEEDIEKSKTADKVFSEASKYYKQKYDEAIKKIDPAFDPKIAESSEVGELTYNSNQRSIKKQIDEGKPLDGVKDIIPLAQEAAENKIGLVNKLKTGTVTTIAEYVGLKSIKDEDSYEEVSEEFNKSVPGAKFEEILSKFWKNMSVFNSDQPGIEAAVQKLYTPENNAIISALAKILEKTGFSSESVKNMSKRFDENLKIYSEQKASKEAMPIPGTTGATGATGTQGATGATGATEVKGEQKLEQKLEQKGATGATTTTSVESATKVEKAEEKLAEKKEETGKAGETKVEGTKAPEAGKEPKTETTKTEITEKKSPEPAKEKQEGPKGEIKMDSAKGGPTPAEPPKNTEAKPSTSAEQNVPKPAQKIEGGGQDLSKPTEKKEGEKGLPSAEKSEEKVGESAPNSGEDSRATFLKSLFGGMIGDLGGGSKEGETGALESSKEELKKEIPKGAESKVESTKAQVSEKIQKKAETIPGGGAIKETTSQKLATPSVAASNKTENATKSETTSEPSTSTTTQEAVTASTTSGATGSGTEEAKGATGEGKGEGGGGLEAKMDSMIALLSQLNSTLQGPLLTINSSKKFD